MSRGLGALQRRILVELGKLGDKRVGHDSISIARSLWREDVGDAEAVPSEAFKVSVRRAIHALTSRELVKVGGGYVDGWRWGGYGERIGLCVWLSEQPKPPHVGTVHLLPAGDVDSVILETLQNADTLIPEALWLEWLDSWDGNRIWHRSVSYQWLSWQVRKRLENRDRVSTAITRSIRRLAERGLLLACRRPTGAYAWVKLTETGKRCAVKHACLTAQQLEVDHAQNGDNLGNSATDTEADRALAEAEARISRLRGMVGRGAV